MPPARLAFSPAKFQFGKCFILGTGKRFVVFGIAKIFAISHEQNAIHQRGEAARFSEFRFGRHGCARAGSLEHDQFRSGAEWLTLY